jgi:hypothetical protein
LDDLPLLQAEVGTWRAMMHSLHVRMDDGGESGELDFHEQSGPERRRKKGKKS